MKNVFPDAEVSAEQTQTRPIRVRIAAEGKVLVNVPQRDLFQKTGWPAEDTIIAALTKFKAERDGE